MNIYVLKNLVINRETGTAPQTEISEGMFLISIEQIGYRLVIHSFVKFINIKANFFRVTFEFYTQISNGTPPYDTVLHGFHRVYAP